MYAHIGTCMGAQKLVLTDSRDEPPSSPMQDERAESGHPIHSSSAITLKVVLKTKFFSEAPI